MEAMDDDGETLKEFIRQQNTRFERFLREWGERTDRMQASIDKNTAVLMDLVEENKAQRAALFRILDRLDAGGGTARP